MSLDYSSSALPSPFFVTGYLIQGSGFIHMLIPPEQQLFTLLITPVVRDADLLTSHRDISMVRRGGGRSWGLCGVCVPLGQRGGEGGGGAVCVKAAVMGEYNRKSGSP